MPKVQAQSEVPSKEQSREQLIAITRREVENLRQDRIDLMPDVLQVPAASYCDPERWQLEVDRIFKRVPLALMFSCELREPGAFRTMEVAGVPLLVSRDRDGSIGAFVNMCSHRGNYVETRESGVAKSFRCGYHAWNYGLNGDLLNVFDEKNFGDVDKSCLGLTRLPVAERAGLIWVTLNPNSNVEIDPFLAGYGEMLDHLGFADTWLVGRQTLEGPNWKVAYDGYRDFYHVPILHRETFGPDMAYQPDYYTWGPHVRMTAPANYQEAANLPEERWTDVDLTPGVWTIFPNVSIAGGPSGRSSPGGMYMVSQLFPGASAGESITIQNFLSMTPPESLEPGAVDAYMARMVDVVRDEDYRTGLRVQKALATGAKAFSLFGRNEGGGQLFHRWVDALVETADQDLPRLLEEGIAV